MSALRSSGHIAYHPANERVKWEYLQYLCHAKGLSDKTAMAHFKAIERYEHFTALKDRRIQEDHIYRSPQAVYQNHQQGIAYN